MTAAQIQQLIDDATCIDTCIPRGMQLAVLIALANDIVSGGGTGGGGFRNKRGNGSPIAAVTPDYIGQYYTDFDFPGGIWVAIGTTNADWRQYLG